MPGGLAMVLSGGGAKGAFQVGVLHELIVERGVHVDIVAGVSTGAIQAAGVAQGEVERLRDVWLGLRGNRDIYTERALSVVGGLFGADAIYGTKPLKTLLKGFVDDAKIKASGRQLLLGVVNLATGVFRSIDQNVPGLHDWVYASCAMPLFFDPLVTRAADGTKEQWVDGGVRDVTPLAAALELNPRGVIVVRAGPPPAPRPPALYSDLIRIGLRAVDILQSEVSVNDTSGATLINDLIAAREGQLRALQAEGVSAAAAARILKPLDQQLARYRFAPIRIIEPETEVSDTLEFDPAKIRAAIDAGRAAVDREWEALEPLLS